MFLPLRDDAPMRHLKGPRVTIGMIGLCSLIYLAMLPASAGLQANMLAAGFGMIPSVLFGANTLPTGLPYVPEWLTPLTSIFLHGSFLHLAGNMLFLWVFGDNVEDAMGHWRYGVFLLWCGAIGALVHAGMNPTSPDPLIGASGAVSGVIAAYLLLYPRVRVFGLALNIIPLTIPASWALGLWVLVQASHAMLGLDAGVGWWAHIGGLAAGALATPFLIRPGVRLFGAQELQPQN